MAFRLLLSKSVSACAHRYYSSAAIHYSTEWEGMLKDALASSERFQSIKDRTTASDHTLESIKKQCKGRYMTRYRGLPLIKSPEDIVIYQQLLEIVKPRTIVEFGAYRGTSALWMADYTSALPKGDGNDKCTVYSVDIDLSLLDERMKQFQPDNVHFIEGDVYQVEKIFSTELLSKMPHPIVVIEDVHHNTEGILQYFHPFFKSGDYIVVEDTHPLVPMTVGMHADTPNYDVWDVPKHSYMKRFLDKHEKQYAVDSFFTDFFGYNYTWNMNGWIRRM